MIWMSLVDFLGFGMVFGWLFGLARRFPRPAPALTTTLPFDDLGEGAALHGTEAPISHLTPARPLVSQSEGGGEGSLDYVSPSQEVKQIGFDGAAHDDILFPTGTLSSTREPPSRLTNHDASPGAVSPGKQAALFFESRLIFRLNDFNSMCFVQTDGQVRFFKSFGPSNLAFTGAVERVIGIRQNGHRLAYMFEQTVTFSEQATIYVEGPLNGTITLRNALDGLEIGRAHKADVSMATVGDGEIFRAENLLQNLDEQSSTSDVKASGSDDGSSDAIQILQDGNAVGFGGFCDLFLGITSRSRRKVAMKRLRIADDPFVLRAKDKLEKEARIWSSLKDPNVLEFMSLAHIGGHTYLVSPWMDFGNLSEFTRARIKYLALSEEGRISDSRRAAYNLFNELNIVCGIASGLQYVHDHGIVHGDIKGNNILLGDDLQPLLCDFGLSKILAEGRTATSSRGAGSWGWMSPELLGTEEPKTVASDMYAFGITISEVLTGNAPFPSHTPAQIYQAVAVKGERPGPPFRPTSRLNQDFGKLWDVASGCWATQASDRPIAREVLRLLGSSVER